MNNTIPALRLTRKEYIANMHKMFAYYGFTQCPLTLGRLSWMYDCNVQEEAAYRIGCDVAAGVSFLKSVSENR